MQPLSEILSPNLPQTDVLACAPDWTRGDFNRAVLQLSGSLRAQSWRTAALWFDDAAEFACAALAAWHAGLTVLLPPNLAAENLAWATPMLHFEDVRMMHLVRNGLLFGYF